MYYYLTSVQCFLVSVTVCLYIFKSFMYYTYCNPLEVETNCSLYLNYRL